MVILMMETILKIVKNVSISVKLVKHQMIIVCNVYPEIIEILILTVYAKMGIMRIKLLFSVKNVL